MIIFWLVLKLEISYKLIEGFFWFLSLRGFFEDYIFVW
jgi:hypothetical protein